VPSSKLLPSVLKELGNNIRRERVAKGMTQQELTAAADLNICNVQRIEAGEFEILLRTAVRMRKAVGCPWEKILPKEWL
jgi:transcriptional regulator with XRE-family HTH domain